MAVFLLCGRLFGTMSKGRPFFIMDTDMDTDTQKCRKIKVFAYISLGSTPTVSTFRGSVENTAFPRFLLISCGFAGSEVCKNIHSLWKVLHSKNGHVWTRIWTRLRHEARQLFGNQCSCLTFVHGVQIVISHDHVGFMAGYGLNLCIGQVQNVMAI